MKCDEDNVVIDFENSYGFGIKDNILYVCYCNASLELFKLDK